MTAVKQQILELLAQANSLAMQQATLAGRTFEQVEMQDADAEDIFEHIRAEINGAVVAVQALD